MRPLQVIEEHKSLVMALIEELEELRAWIMALIEQPVVFWHFWNQHWTQILEVMS
jgi:hypothetical protein